MSRMGRMSLALFLAGFATFSLIYSTQPLLPQLAAEFHLTPAASSLALSLTTGCLAVAIFCVGALSESMSRRATMFASICAAAVLNVLAAVAPRWPWMLTARSLEGVVLGGVPAVAMAYLAEETPAAQLGHTMGLYVAGTAFGGMTGRVAIGIFAQLVSWRFALAAMSVIDLLAAVAFLALLPPSRHFAPRRNLGFHYHLNVWHEHLQNGELKALFVIAFLCMGAFVTVYNYTGFRLTGPPYSLNPSQIGLIFLAYLLGMGASSGAGALVHAVSRRGAILVGAGVFLIGLGFTLSRHLPAIIAGIGLITIGFFTIHSVASSSLGQLAQRAKGHASSLYLLSYYAGASLLGSAGGSIWHSTGWSGVTVYGVVLMLMVMAATWFTER